MKLSDYIVRVRILLQDKVEPYRYGDDEMQLALNLAFTAAFRMRPDMFVKRSIPNYLGADTDTEIDVEAGYEEAFMYYMAGHIQLQDTEDTQDARATVFLNKFTAQLMATAA